MNTSIVELQNQIIKLQQRMEVLEENTLILKLQVDMTQNSIDAVFDL